MAGTRESTENMHILQFLEPRHQHTNTCDRKPTTRATQVFWIFCGFQWRVAVTPRGWHSVVLATRAFKKFTAADLTSLVGCEFARDKLVGAFLATLQIFVLWQSTACFSAAINDNNINLCSAHSCVKTKCEGQWGTWCNACKPGTPRLWNFRARWEETVYSQNCEHSCQSSTHHPVHLVFQVTPA